MAFISLWKWMTILTTTKSAVIYCKGYICNVLFQQTLLHCCFMNLLNFADTGTICVRIMSCPKSFLLFRVNTQINKETCCMAKICASVFQMTWNGSSMKHTGLSALSLMCFLPAICYLYSQCIFYVPSSTQDMTAFPFRHFLSAVCFVYHQLTLWLSVDDIHKSSVLPRFKIWQAQ